jgi:hydroxymethylpyrimidine/phosphomethylpyrimidine kinase
VLDREWVLAQANAVINDLPVEAVKLGMLGSVEMVETVLEIMQRLPGSYHGSGCTLASTLAGRLALGQELVSAVEFALDYTWRTLRDAEQPGHGQFIPRRLPLDAY